MFTKEELMLIYTSMTMVRDHIHPKSKFIHLDEVNDLIEKVSTIVTGYAYYRGCEKHRHPDTLCPGCWLEIEKQIGSNDQLDRFHKHILNRKKK